MALRAFPYHLEKCRIAILNGNPGNSLGFPHPAVFGIYLKTNRLVEVAQDQLAVSIFFRCNFRTLESSLLIHGLVE